MSRGPASRPSAAGSRGSPAVDAAPRTSLSLSVVVFSLKYMTELVEWMAKIAATTEQVYIVQYTLQGAVDKSFLYLYALEEVLGGIQEFCKIHFTNSSSPLCDFSKPFISHLSVANKNALLISRPRRWRRCPSGRARLGQHHPLGAALSAYLAIVTSATSGCAPDTLDADSVPHPDKLNKVSKGKHHPEP